MTPERAPVRIQLRRTKGWRLPAGAVVVSRPSKWGNPFTVSGSFIVWTAVALGNRADLAGRTKTAITLYRAWLTGEGVPPGPQPNGDDAIGYEDGTEMTVAEAAQCMAVSFAKMFVPEDVGRAAPPLAELAELRGRDLACWCPLPDPGQPDLCHAAILIELANR